MVYMLLLVGWFPVYGVATGLLVVGVVSCLSCALMLVVCVYA